MRDPNRLNELYDYLKEIHKQNFPDWRFFQFMVNFIQWYGRDPFYLEDDKIKEKIEHFVKATKIHDNFVNKKLQ